MILSEALIDHLAHLCKLEFVGEDKQLIREDMEKIVKFMNQLEEIPTDDIEPLIFMNEDVNRLREDEIKAEITHEEALKNAPKKDTDYFRIPKVLDK